MPVTYHIDEAYRPGLKTMCDFSAAITVPS